MPILLTSISFFKLHCQGKTSYSPEMLRTSTHSAGRRLDAANGQGSHKLFSLEICARREGLAHVNRGDEFHNLFSNPRLVAVRLRLARLAILLRRMKLRAAEQAGAGSNTRTMAQYGEGATPS
jgi:hypothetical protein